MDNLVRNHLPFKESECVRHRRMTTQREELLMNLLGRLIAAAVFVVASTSFASAQIKIGAVLSVTGPASFLGDPEKKTLEMYARRDQCQRRHQWPKTSSHHLRRRRRPEPGAHLCDPPDRGRQGRRAARGFNHRNDHGDHSARRRSEDPADQFRRRGAGSRSGKKVEFQNAAYRPDGLREDFRRPSRSASSPRSRSSPAPMPSANRCAINA